MNRRSNQGCRCGQNTDTTTPRTCNENTENRSLAITTTSAGNNGCGCGCGRGEDDFALPRETESRRDNCDNADETCCSGVFTVEGCCDYVRQNIGTLSLSGVGQVINASLTLCNVCPNRAVALGVTLSEIDRCGCETNIAFKTFEITTPNKGCRNIKVRDIIFVVPQNSDNGKRCFRLRATANYLDTNVCI